MLNSKKLLIQAKIIPKLRLAIKEEGKAPVPTGPHRVKIISDGVQNGKDYEGKVVPIVRYIFEENGEQKRYDRPVKNKEGELDYLVQQLSEVPEGSELILEMKKKGIKNYVSVSVVGHSNDIEVGEEEVEGDGEETINVPSPEGVDYPENDLPPSPF